MPCATFVARPGAALRPRPDLLELPEHLPGIRSHRRRLVHAVQRQLQRVHELVARGPIVAVAHQLEVEHLAGPLLLDNGRHPLRQVHAVGGLGGGFAGEELEDDDAEAVHVGLGTGLLELGQLGGAVAEGAGGGEDVGVGSSCHEAGEAEVGDLGVGVVVEEDIAGGEVAVDDGHVVVEESKATGCALGDRHPRLPADRSVGRASCT
ncbi:Os12g0107733, partial [Oryza sativa Japonica Group]